MIIGKLIPAGTGIPRYRNVEVNPTEEARAAAFSMAGYDENDYYGFGSSQALGPAVPLDDYGYDDYRVAAALSNRGHGNARMGEHSVPDFVSGRREIARIKELPNSHIMPPRVRVVHHRMKAVQEAIHLALPDDQRRDELDHLQMVPRDLGEDAVPLQQRHDDQLREEALARRPGAPSRTPQRQDGGGRTRCRSSGRATDVGDQFISIDERGQPC